MKLTPINLNVHDLGLGTTSSVRAEGLHASTIYNDFFADYNPKKYKYAPGPIDPLLVEIGLIFETMLERGLQERLLKSQTLGEVVRPGEFTYRATFKGKPIVIHYNPDLFIVNGVLRVTEIKSTWMWSGVTHEEISRAQEGIEAAIVKLRDLLLDPKYDKYLAQLKFYLKMLGERLGRLYIFFVTANGRPPFPSQLLGWDLDFTQEELDRNYNMLMNHALAKGMLG